MTQPDSTFLVDTQHGVVTWTANGLRLVHAPQFRALADIFAGEGMWDHLAALNDAELAVSEVIVRRQLQASVEMEAAS